MPVVLAAVAAQVFARPERIVVSLFINRVAQGDAVVVRLGRDVYVRARDLPSLHFSRTPSTRTVAGELYDSLDSTGITYSFDSITLRLDLSYRSDVARRIEIAASPPPLYDRVSSANVAFSGSLLSGPSLQLSELGTLAVPEGQVHLGFANALGGIYRTEFAAEIFQRDEDGEILAGDQTMTSPTMAALPVFGLGVTRGTLVRTSGVRAPYERVTGKALDPTEIEIDVGASAPIEIGVEPGAFSIDGVPIAARITAVDELTNLPIQIVASPPLDSQLLSPGWRESGAAIGKMRTCVYACDAYRGLAAGGYILKGDSLFLSSGVHAAYAGGRIGAGYDVIDSDANRALRISAGLGPLDGILVAYEQRTGALSFGAGYSTNGAPAYDDAGRLIVRARSLSQTFSASYRRMRVECQREDRSLAGNVRTCDLVELLPIRHSALQLDLRDRFIRLTEARLSLGVRLLLALHGGRENTALGATLGPHAGPASELSSQLDMPSGLEFGADASGTLRAGYSSNAFEVSASQPGMLTVYGAIAFLHGVHLVRETSGGYVIAVGRGGDTIVASDGRSRSITKSSTAFPLEAIDRPTVLAYRQRNVTVDDDASLSTPAIFPAPDAGSLVVVTHRRLFSIIGTIANPKWRYATITLSGGKRSPVGADGVFYFEGLSSGEYRARVTGAGGSCTTTIVVPSTSAPQVNLGIVACRSM